MPTTRIDVTIAKSADGPSIAFSPEEAHFVTGDGVELVLGGDADATFADDPVSFDEADAAERFDLRRSTDGRRIVLANRGPSDFAAVARYGYHVQVVVDGETVRSEGYPTVNQHPPIGG